MTKCLHESEFKFEFFYVFRDFILSSQIFQFSNYVNFQFISLVSHDHFSENSNNVLTMLNARNFFGVGLYYIEFHQMYVPAEITPDVVLLFDRNWSTERKCCLFIGLNPNITFDVEQSLVRYINVLHSADYYSSKY